jgi:hypothetical protein
MQKKLMLLLLCSMASLALLAIAAPNPKPAFEYAADGRLKFPTDYRQWVFLSSGVGMTYGPLAAAGRMGPPMFDNVFVNPESYRAFIQTGHWPDKSIFILEVRTSESHASINKDGHFQSDVMGIEAEVKDSSAKTGEWTFYGFGNPSNPETATGNALGHEASCYACHGKNTAVENTFVQFYPVLYDIALKKGTLNPAFKAMPITVGKLVDLIAKEGWNSGANVLNTTAVQSPDAAVLDPGNLNMVAYHLVDAKHPADAVSLLKWTAEKHPESANLQDSLADAYLAAGDKDGARSATKRSLELAQGDPSLTPAQKENLAKLAESRLKKL